MSIQLKAESGAICTLSLSFNNDGPLGTFFRYIGDNGTWIARYDDLVHRQEEPVDLTPGRTSSSNGIELQDREFVAADPRRPRAQCQRGAGAPLLASSTGSRSNSACRPATKHRSDQPPRGGCPGDPTQVAIIGAGRPGCCSAIFEARAWTASSSSARRATYVLKAASAPGVLGDGDDGPDDAGSASTSG